MSGEKEPGRLRQQPTGQGQMGRVQSLSHYSALDRPGQNRKGAGARDLTLTVRVNQAERDALRKLAGQRQVTVASLLRGALLRVLLEGAQERKRAGLRLVGGGRRAIDDENAGGRVASKAAS